MKESAFAYRSVERDHDVQVVAGWVLVEAQMRTVDGAARGSVLKQRSTGLRAQLFELPITYGWAGN
jgi:hypothetical protein